MTTRRENVIGRLGASYVMNALHYFQWEKQEGQSRNLREPYKRAAACLQLGESTIRKIRRVSENGTDFSKYSDTSLFPPIRDPKWSCQSNGRM